MKRIIVLLVFNLLSFSLLAQVMEVGLFGGTSSYIGDMNQTNLYKNVQIAVGGTVRYNFNTRVSARLDVKRNKLSIVDDNPGVFILPVERPQNIDPFTTWSTSAMGEFNFFPYFIGSKKQVWTPYVFGGIGVNYNLIKEPLDPVNYDFKRLAFTVPFGFGFKYSITTKLGMTVDWTLIRTFGDQLDGLMENYYSADNPRQYSDESSRDYLSQIGLTLLYKIDLRSKHKCYGIQE